MKTRIFSVLGLLVLCAVLSTGGSRAWAVTSTNTLNGQYSCGFTGVTTPTFLAFDGSGVLNVINGDVAASPPGTLWTFDVFGFSLIDIAVGSGTFSATNHGQGNLSLVFIPPAPPIPGLIPLEFDNNVVMSNIDQAGIAHTFVFTLQPPPTFIDIVLIGVCQAQSAADGNPIP